MKDKKKIDKSLMFEQACAFLECADYAQKNNGPDARKSNGYVYVSLAALACEIYLKCLIINENGAYKNEHSLEELWKIYKNLNMGDAEKTEKKVDGVFGTQGAFDNMLKDSSKAFTLWRYIFDYQDSDAVVVVPQFLRVFSNALRFECCKEIKGITWEEYLEQR